MRFILFTLLALFLWPRGDALSQEESEYIGGERLYRQWCSQCHGRRGSADTPVAQALRPKPAKLSDPVAMALLKDEDIYRVIDGGRPGTAMASWGEILSPSEIRALITYIRSLVPAGQRGLPRERLDFLAGKRIYGRYCVSCHGPDGRARTELAAILRPRPRNFTSVKSIKGEVYPRFFRAIKEGIPGTAMAGWGKILKDAEIERVIKYIREEFKYQREQPSLGMLIYRERCSLCHGLDGTGNTPLGRVLEPRPRDFTDLQVMAAIEDTRLIKSIREGIQGTAMAAWRKVLTDREILEVVAYIKGFIPPEKRELPLEEVLLLRGREVYERNCARCHGLDGKAGTTLGKILRPRPRDFTDPRSRGRLTEERMRHAIREGRPGTAMGAWSPTLTDEEIEDVLFYIRKSFLAAKQEAP